MAIPKEVHQKITAFYSSKPKFAKGKTVREWLRSKSFEEQQEFGRMTVQEYMDKYE